MLGGLLATFSGCVVVVREGFGRLAGVEALQLEVDFWDVYMPIDRGELDAVPGF